MPPPRFEGRAFIAVVCVVKVLLDINTFSTVMVVGVSC